jgi:SAM-dependent methyltransferase
MNPSDQTSYSRRHARRYRQGRDLPGETMACWADAVGRRISEEPQLIVDLGAGTGRFSHLLAERLSGHVLAVEPSSDMTREVDLTTIGVSWVRARAEWLPVADGSCDVVWASQVVHHFGNQVSAAQEIARVLRFGGRLLLRGTFGDSVEAVSWLPWFPEARRLGRDHIDLQAFAAVLADVGLHLVAHDRVTQVVASDLAGLHQRTSARADSFLDGLSDEEFNRGLNRLLASAQAHPEPFPITERVDLITYERRS